MPIGPNGEKRPPAVIANAVISMRIATGQTDETIVKTLTAAKAATRPVALSGKRPSRVTMLAAVARWGPPRRAKGMAIGRA
ncbi:MAG: RNA-binding protein [Gammaproteobacteria bacterium]|nr:RNA-binding protein [Gammaproteobacteria bacterium]